MPGPMRWVCMLALLACGEPGAAMPEDAAVCGGAGPRLLLALEQREYVERVELLDPQQGAQASLLLEVVAYDDALPQPHDLRRRLFASDACGEQVRELGPGLELADVGELVLACRGDALLAVDPITGSEQAIVDEVSCAGWASAAGVLAVRPIDARWGALILADPLGAALPRTLVDAVRLPTASPVAANPFALADGRALVLTPDGELQELDVDGGALDTLDEGVADFRASEDLRWLLVQHGVPDDPDPLATGAITLVDRVGDRQTELLRARLSWTRLAFFGSYVAVREQSWGDERLFAREHGEPIAMPEAASLRHVLDDARVIYAVGSGDWHDLDLRIWDPRSNEHRALLRGAALVGFAADGLERFSPSEALGLQVGRLGLLSYDDGSERELVAALAWPYVRREDGSILSLRDDDGDGLGELRLYPADGGDPIVLASDAYAHDPSLSRARAFAPDVVFHGARDGVRGLWRMHVPP
jgi:hypothetical protein